MKPRPSLGFVGAGRLAGALAPLLAGCGYTVAGFHSRDPRSARRIARRVSGSRAFLEAASLAAACDVLLLAVPDSVLGSLMSIRGFPDGAWRGKTVLHHAGALGPEVLAPLARRGAHCGVLHPLQVMTDPAVLARVLPGSRARIEGNPTAVRVARRIARDLGMKPLTIERLGKAGRAAYHTAASLTANDAAALLGEASRLLVGLGLERREALRALVPLLRGVVEHAASGELGPALTGPVPRGDVDTLRTHLEVLRRRAPHAERAHRALGSSLISLVEQHGSSLTAAQRERLRRLLESS